MSQMPLLDLPRYVLISLRPEFEGMIVRGEKDVEFRRRFPNERTFTFVYVVEPVAAITMALELAEPVEDPAQLKGRSGVGVAEFRAGLKPGRKALPIMAVHRLSRPVPAQEMRRYGVWPPQSFIYLDKRPEFLRALIDLVSGTGQVPGGRR